MLVLNVKIMFSVEGSGCRGSNLSTSCVQRNIDLRIDFDFMFLLS
uniref:Uncharacterized protein n=1 Tax=Anguilla anguilla TaxID=7936 RepID=A0A0E9QZF5_ANGAN